LPHISKGIQTNSYLIRINFGDFGDFDLKSPN